MADASVKVICRFRPINRMERGEWEANRIGELLKIEELDTLLPEFQKKKNAKFQGKGLILFFSPFQEKMKTFFFFSFSF